MAVDYRGLRSLTARELIAALIRDGFYFVRQTGSHQRYRHLDGRRVTGRTARSWRHVTAKTLRSIIESQARWTDEDLKGLKLVN